MKISRNPDWENASKRLEAFWHHEIIDRPCVQIYAPAPKEDYADLEPMPECDYETLWTDPEMSFRNFRQGYMRTVYMGEVLPVLYPNWCGTQKMLGSELQYDSGTIWVHPTAETLLDLDPDRLRMDDPEVTRLLDKLAYCAEHARGEAFVGLPPMGNAGDTLAMAYGYCNLCMDLVEDPDAINAIETKLTAFWKKMYDAVYNTVNQHMQGSCGWLPSWYSGRSALIEFDLGALVSPEMFKMYLPHLLERAEHTQRSIYHLDGPDALIHLDTILAQKEFDAIQWEPGIACADIREWIPVMQKIQAAGKGLFVAGPRFSAEAVLELLKNLKPEGLIVPLSVRSVAEGERFLETVARMF